MNKIKVLCVPSDNTGGVGFYRSIQPHAQLGEQYAEEFDVTITTQIPIGDWNFYKSFDIVHFHANIMMVDNYEGIQNVIKGIKEMGIKVVVDIDDYWDLPISHPLYNSRKIGNHSEKIKWGIANADYVTTTTPLFAEKIRKLNKNVIVLPNAINPEDDRFKVKKPQSELLRIGFVMGSSHEPDMAVLQNFVSKLPQSTIDKIQIVLCGFDTRGTTTLYDPVTHKSTSRPIKPTESVWARYEYLVTDGYRIIDENYKHFLLSYIPDIQYPGEENKHYRRCWTKDINNYFQHYANVDVLIVPLEENEFNRYKSQLKVIESAFSNTAVIASDFGPYKIDLVSAIEKGGGINPKGNALLVDKKRGHKLWPKYVTMLANNPDLVKQLQENLHTDIAEKYDLRTVTKTRAEFYKDLIKKGQ